MNRLIISLALALLALLGGCAELGPGTPSLSEAQRARQAALSEDLGELQQDVRSLKAAQEEHDRQFSDEQFGKPLQESIGRIEARIDELEGRVRELEHSAAMWDNKMQAVVDVVKSENVQLRAAIEKLRRGSLSHEGQHTVSAGETIADIARRYGARAKDIIEANDIQDPRKIRVGQKLTIPNVER
ncbi:MAG: LysM peptidoglycan-binding domain-containing protein [Candidatus Aureabacteria bacterium]|nr:LysM peptidoglycan-binding domain-containing protein [Candidatus Auribacterota bacterium]